MIATRQRLCRVCLRLNRSTLSSRRAGLCFCLAVGFIPADVKAESDFIDRRVATMQVSVSARHGSLQPGDQELIQEKAIKLRRLYDRVNLIEVTVDLENTVKPAVEIQVSIEHAGECVATAEASTVIAALDMVIPKVEQQLRRIKEKKTGHRATGHKHIETPTDDA
jgi:putative sigma-54 modulation protein